jgi:hypothetical protein
MNDEQNVEETVTGADYKILQQKTNPYPGYSKKVMARPKGTTITNPKDNNVNIKPMPKGAGGKSGTRGWDMFSGPNGPKDSDHDNDRPGPRMGRGPGRRGK